MTTTPGLVRAVQIGTECLAISKALDELRIAFGNDNRRDADLYASPLRQELAGYRDALRIELVAMSDNPMRVFNVPQAVDGLGVGGMEDRSPEIDIWTSRTISGLRSNWRIGNVEESFRSWLIKQEAGLMDLPGQRLPYTEDRARWITTLVTNRALGQPDMTFSAWLSLGMIVL